jgi:tetratricopeptide (TPR) repeat protein
VAPIIGGTLLVRGTAPNGKPLAVQPLALVWVALGRDTSCTPAGPAGIRKDAPLYTPQRLFGEVSSASDILNHEPFLERARLQREQEHDASARLALGAYVVARLVDKLFTTAIDESAIDGFRWQLDAVRRHIQELPPDAPETAHLAGIVASVPTQGRPSFGLWKGLTAYAYFLEHEGRLEESLEILAQAARVHGSEMQVDDFAAYALFAGRLNRRLAKWDVATVCYKAAEEAAVHVGDKLSMLRGRLGRGAVHRGQGNLPAARASAESVLREAIELEITEAQAMAYADLGAIYDLQGMILESLDAKYQAFRLSREMPQQMRALGEVAIGLVEIGAFEAARLAFQIVTESSASVEVRTNALLELMDLESSLGNRVAFERCRASAEVYRARMSPSMSVDYHFKLGTGLARFGQTGRARTAFTNALELAERHRLNAWYFKVEKALRDLAERNEEQALPRQATELSEAPVVREMELGLRQYAAMAAS